MLFLTMATFYVIMNLTQLHSLQVVAFFLFVVSWISLVVTAIYQIKMRKWFVGLLLVTIFLLTIPAYSYYGFMMFWVVQSRPDGFADDLTIPSDVHGILPADLDGNKERPDSVLSRERSALDFEVYNSFQPGIFEYDVWLTRIDSGYIYLKAYEVTTNQRLSDARLQASTSLIVCNPSDSLKRFESTWFTVYEGDWGKPYAARFELWYNTSKGGQER
jgi:hypothetical protein